jgi:hypothetical protein
MQAIDVEIVGANPDVRGRVFSLRCSQSPARILPLDKSRSTIRLDCRIAIYEG